MPAQFRKTVHPDKALVQDQLDAMQALISAFGLKSFLEMMLWILPKEPEECQPGEFYTLIPFLLNLIQEYILGHITARTLLLKARQIGGTTFYLLVRILIPAVTARGIGSLLISQNNEYAEKHFRIARRAFRYFGYVDPYKSDEVNALGVSLHQHALHTVASNRREIVLDQLDSVIMIASAEVEESGQGPTLHHILADEYSRWPGDPEATLSNVQGALVPTGTLDKNCTANGAAGPFFEDVLRAMNDPKHADLKLFFFGWHWTPEYMIALTSAQKDELEADLTADEVRLIAKMHRELKDVAWVKNKKAA